MFWSLLNQEKAGALPEESASQPAKFRLGDQDQISREQERGQETETGSDQPVIYDRPHWRVGLSGDHACQRLRNPRGKSFQRRSVFYIYIDRPFQHFAR